MEEWKNGRMEEWKNGRMAEDQNGEMAEWKNSRIAEERNERIAELGKLEILSPRSGTKFLAKEPHKQSSLSCSAAPL